MTTTNTTTSNNGIWIGVDFGTTHCSVAVWDSTRGSPKWIRLTSLATPEPSKPGRLVPSQAVLVENNSKLDHQVTTTPVTSDISAALGHSAVQLWRQACEQEDTHNGTTVETIANARVVSLKRHFAAGSTLKRTLLTNDDSSQSVELAPGVLVASFLKALRLDTDAYLQKEARRKQLKTPGASDFTAADSTDSASDSSLPLCAKHVVLGVPAHYTQQQRQAMKDAALQAGFVSASTMIESTAAALSYGFGLSTHPESHIVVCDMGGGTFDVSVCEYTNDQFQVVATHGDAQLGGDDMDQCLADYVVKKASESADSGISSYEMQTLLWSCQSAKEQLCTTPDHPVSIRFRTQTIQITIHELDELIAPLLERAKQTVLQLLKQTSRVEQRPSEVVLIGGATRVPAVRRMLAQLFSFQLEQLCTSVNPMSAVAQGAAIQAAVQSNTIPRHELESALMLDCTPHALGVLCGNDNFVEILPRYASLPAKGYASFRLADSRQAGVSVQAVEQVANENEENQLVPVADFTFLLHRLPENSMDQQRWVDIGMTLGTDGALKVSIFDEKDPEHIRKKERFQRQQGETATLGYTAPSEEFTREQVLLLVGCIVLFVLYVGIKIAFSDLEQLTSAAEL